MNIFRTKTVEQTIREADEGEHKLKRELSALDLLVFGVGIIIGTGIFVLTGIAAATNFGTLLAFILVSIGIVVLRRTNPDLKRAFRVPLVPLLPVLAVLTCLYLLISLPIVTWIRFVVWLVIGIVIYFAYGARHSRLATEPQGVVSTRKEG